MGNNLALWWDALRDLLWTAGGGLELWLAQIPEAYVGQAVKGRFIRNISSVSCCLFRFKALCVRVRVGPLRPASPLVGADAWMCTTLRDGSPQQNYFSPDTCLAHFSPRTAFRWASSTWRPLCYYGGS